jgi:hypothetical protein
MPKDLLEKFSTALVAALATTLVAVSSEWLRQRGQDARLKRDVDQSTSRINRRIASSYMGSCRRGFVG